MLCFEVSVRRRLGRYTAYPMYVKMERDGVSNEYQPRATKQFMLTIDTYGV